MHRRKVLILGIVAASALAGSVVYGSEHWNEEQNEVRALAQAKISLVQAIETAERHAGGKATSARLEDEDGKVVYEVEVIGSDKATQVKVDSRDGKVLSARADEKEREAGDADKSEERGEH